MFSTTTLPRVLCVDDDDDAGEMLSWLMRPHGIEVKSTQSPAEALRMIAQQDFDLYVLDAWLPQISGFELCCQIREVDLRTPILFYSGAAFPADLQKGIEAGANAYLTKPDIDGLIKTVVDQIALAKAADSLRSGSGLEALKQFPSRECDPGAAWCSVLTESSAA